MPFVAPTDTDHVFGAVTVAGVVHTSCGACGAPFGPQTMDPKLSAAVIALDIDVLNPQNVYRTLSDMTARQYVCTSCGALIAVDIQPTNDTEVFVDMRVAT